MRSKYMLIGVVGMVVGVLLSSAVFVLAGNPDSPAAPGATQSFTLEDIYNRLDSGADGAQSTFTEPGVAPGTGTMHTLNETMGKAPAKDDANGATTGDVANGKTFWGLTAGEWGTQTGTAVGATCTGDATAGDVLTGKTFSNATATGIAGTMPDKEGDNASTAQARPGTVSYFTAPEGYYDGDDRVSATDAEVAALDTDITAGNIKSGVNIFGVDGTLVCEACAAGVPKIGQTKCYDAAGSEITCTGTGQDGDLQKGVAWPSPRFTDNADGTVTDNLTGLIWLKDADCMGSRTWSDALTQVGNLNSGTNFNCDNYTAGTFSDWRLPNVRELFSLIHHGQANSATWLNGQGFTGVQSNYYWSSTSYAPSTYYAWYVSLSGGYVNGDTKNNSRYVWPVRGGQ